MSRRVLISGLLFFALLSCKGGDANKTGTPAETKPSVRTEFPGVSVPGLITDQDERMDYFVTHFWDKFLSTEASFLTDSTHMAGLGRDVMEQAMGTYVSALEFLPLEEAKTKVADLYRAVSGTGVFIPFTDLLSRYLYDPNSPARSEDLWLPYVEALGHNETLPADKQHSYAFQARMCRLNSVGSIATDFAFTDSRGRERTLHSIKAEYLLLIFGNPGCKACQDLVEAMAADRRTDALVKSGRLVVADIYIDNEIGEWLAHRSEYPSDWINGYDHNYIIRQDLLYNVRAIPSIYLLDAEKRVILKDTTPERLFEKLVIL